MCKQSCTCPTYPFDQKAWVLHTNCSWRCRKEEGRDFRRVGRDKQRRAIFNDLIPPCWSVGEVLLMWLDHFWVHFQEGSEMKKWMKDQGSWVAFGCRWVAWWVSEMVWCVRWWFGEKLGQGCLLDMISIDINHTQNKYKEGFPPTPSHPWPLNHGYLGTWCKGAAYSSSLDVLSSRNKAM